MGIYRFIILASVGLSLLGCDDTSPWNSPYPADVEDDNIYYAPFVTQPRYLDPAKSYSADEWAFIGQIYEPPLQYHFLKRPYTLVPLSASEMPTVTYYDAGGQKLPEGANFAEIATSVYDIHIRPGMLYQPHPAFALDEAGEPLYLSMSANELRRISTLADFERTDTREVVAEDYVYAIKRLAHPGIGSPILSIMQDYVIGLGSFSADLQQRYTSALSDSADHPVYLPLHDYTLIGASAIDDYHYQITINGKNPQFLYWLAMSFFAPLPWEVERFYAEPGFSERNLNLDWYPVGSGPYQLTVNNPNREMVLVRNPNFHGELYPSEGDADDAIRGYLDNANKSMPFIDKVVFSLEREIIPVWNKFTQGYYDRAAVTNDTFNQAIHVNPGGAYSLSEALAEQDITLQTSVPPTLYYWAFNMQDPVVGGNSERARKLRQAISIAIDVEEYISIFLNGSGELAQGPIPPGLEGYQSGEQGINPYRYLIQEGKMTSIDINMAKELMLEAGYVQGRDVITGEPLVIDYDYPSIGAPDERATIAWLEKQFNKLEIQLNVRPNQIGRYQEKVQLGNVQFFNYGWIADFPDPENFLFLLYGPNAAIESDGVNFANYDNPEFNALYAQMRFLDDSPERLAMIEQMIDIVRHDGPWVFGYYPENITLSHQWMAPSKPNEVAQNTLKYQSLHPVIRADFRSQWNPPIVWPFILAAVIILLLMVPIMLVYWQKQHHPPDKQLPPDF